MIRRMAALGAAFFVLMAMAGCAAVTAVVGVIGAGAVVARDAYCTGASEGGRQYVRDRVTGGVQVIQCPEYTSHE